MSLDFNIVMANRAVARARIRARLEHGTVWTAPGARTWAVVASEGDGWRVATLDRDGVLESFGPPTMAAVVDVLMDLYGSTITQMEIAMTCAPLTEFCTGALPPVVPTRLKRGTKERRERCSMKGRHHRAATGMCRS